MRPLAGQRPVDTAGADPVEEDPALTNREPRESRSSQLLKGVLDMLLLALIAEQPRYGYEMVQELGRRGLELVSEGSIYPVLGRLEKAGLVEGSFEPSPQGPPRKYYHLRPEGWQVLQHWVDEWRRFARGVTAVLERCAVAGAEPAPAPGSEGPERSETPPPW